MADTLFIGTNGWVVAMRPNDGEEVWRTALGGGGIFRESAYQDVCILHYERYVFAGCYGHLFCLDAATGEELWHNQLSGLGHNDITLSIANHSVQYVSTRARQ